MNVEQHLDNLFTNAANERLTNSKGKVYEYKLLDSSYTETIASGRCIVINRYYSREVDCDIVVIEDIKTQKQYSVNQFRIELKEVY